MDEMKIRTKFMKMTISKLLSIMIKKKTGYKIDIQLNELDITFNEDGKAHIHINADGEMNSNELKKITKVIGIEDES